MTEAGKNNPAERDLINELPIQKLGVSTLAQAQEKLKAEAESWKGSEYSTTSTAELIFSLATELDASDVHFETSREGARLRFRLDGLLYDLITVPERIYDLVLNRIKLISGLKINVTNSPQDGRFSMKRADMTIDASVSTIPAEFG